MNLGKESVANAEFGSWIWSARTRRRFTLACQASPSRLRVRPGRFGVAAFGSKPPSKFRPSLRRSAETPLRQDDFSATSLISVFTKLRATSRRDKSPLRNSECGCSVEPAAASLWRDNPVRPVCGYAPSVSA